MKAVAKRLVLCAALVATAVGCGGATPLSVAPTPFPSSSDSSSSPRPSPSDASLPWVVVVPFPDDPAGRSLELTIVDDSGLVGSVRAATGPEITLADLGDDGAGFAPVEPDGSALVVAWTGVVCDLTATLTVAPSVTDLTIEEGLAPGCDLVPVPRGVVLTLAAPRTAETTTVVLVRNVPIEAIARSQAEAAALGYWGPSASVTGVRFARAADLDPRLAPPDRIVWAVTVDSGELPGSCPSLAPGVDPFPQPPCRAAASATLFLDAATGTYLGAAYGGS